jgi:hypothetical protein
MSSQYPPAQSDGACMIWNLNLRFFTYFNENLQKYKLHVNHPMEMNTFQSHLSDILHQSHEDLFELPCILHPPTERFDMIQSIPNDNLHKRHHEGNKTWDFEYRSPYTPFQSTIQITPS